MVRIRFAPAASLQTLGPSPPRFSRASARLWCRGGFAIITTEPNELCAELHDRMPVPLAQWPTPLRAPPRRMPPRQSRPNHALECRIFHLLPSFSRSRRSPAMPYMICICGGPPATARYSQSRQAADQGSPSSETRTASASHASSGVTRMRRAASYQSTARG
jgi:hypothetical protein